MILVRLLKKSTDARLPRPLPLRGLTFGEVLGYPCNFNKSRIPRPEVFLTGLLNVYCHMKEGSLRVKPTDKVKKGQVIGQVGNTGNSGAPHLHFQLQNSPDFITANGLPMMFENVPASTIVAEYPVQTNNLCFSDNLFIAVP